jgi:TatD DNase family protein
MLVDSHAHLDGPRFEADREQVLARAAHAGVEAIVTIGTGDGPGTLDCAVKLADAYPDGVGTGLPQLYATIGIHPHEASRAGDEDFAQLQALSHHPRVIAWGEIGLDYYYTHSPRETQQMVFLRQMELAHASNLPIVIHCRPSDNTGDAWQDCLRLLEQHWRNGLGGVLHCFTGDWEHARRALDLGFMISFAGNITFPKAAAIREAARQVPLDRLLVETDSPYLAPVPHRGKRNEPAFVAETARYLGELRGFAEGEMAHQTAQNFRRFFSLHEKAEAI